MIGRVCRPFGSVAQEPGRGDRYSADRKRTVACLTRCNRAGWRQSVSVFAARRRRGRAATDALIDLADTVSVIADEKHAFRAGVKAQRGVDW